jgi:hypothetical protein
MSQLLIDIDDPLLVPIHLDALVATTNNGLFKDLSPNLDALRPNYGLGEYAEPDVKPNSNTNFYNSNPGIHLHWVLPKGFRHGTYTAAGNTVNFPLAPNRWLIIRGDDQLQWKAWMVESDYIDATATTGFNWMQMETNGSGTTAQQYIPAKIGRTVALPDWTETNPATLFLQAVAAGDAGFAAAYLHCKDVFGFYDDMSGATAGSVFTYRVYGWFSDTAADPLSTCTDEDSFKAKLNELSLSLPGVDTLTAVPATMLCHATVYGVPYGNKVSATIPSLSDISLGIGNTASEALGALLVGKIGGEQQPLAQKLLAAYQYQLLKDNGLQSAGLDVLEKERHQRTFNKVDGGTQWLVQEKQKANANADDPSQTPYNAPFSSTISALLLNLNTAQQTYDSSKALLRSYQEQLYATVYKQNDALCGAASDFSQDQWDTISAAMAAQVSDCTQKIQGLVSVLGSLKTLLNAADNDPVWPTAYSGQLPDLYNQLVTALGNDPTMKDYEVKEAPMWSYFEAAEPAIVVDGLSPADRYIASDQGAQCRLPATLVDTFQIVFEGAPYRVGANALLPLATIEGIAPANSALLDKVAGLLQESVLLDPGSAVVLAKVIKTFNVNLSPAEMKALETAIQTCIGNYPDNAGNFLNGDVPATLPELFSVAAWQQPWIPLFLEWGVQWYGIRQGNNDGDVFSSWLFGDAGHQYDYAPDSGSSTEPTGLYYGRTIVSTEMVNRIDALNAKLRAYSGTDFFQTMRPVSQNLSGLSGQLITRYPGLQLPILTDQLAFDPVNDLLSGRYPWRPQPGEKNFFPLRGGAFNVIMLRVVDAFGQVLEILDPASRGKIVPAFKNSAGLGTIAVGPRTVAAEPGTVAAGSKMAYLCPPRILQPARMRFEWLSAAMDGRVTDSDPATNPVCGWLLTNKLDNSIAVYDADGIEIGELKLVGEAVQLLPPPGGSASTLKNSRLSNLLAGIQASPDNFNALQYQLGKVVKKVQTNSSRQLFSMPMPIGLPIAVAGAQCTLETKGLPATSQYWLPGGTTDLTQLAFKTFFGNSTALTDGLVGFFFGETADKLYLPFLDTVDDGSYTFLQENTGLGLQPGATTEITVLMDPRSVVSITSGILPAAAYGLPPHAVLKPLQELSLRFLAAPVITPVKQLQVPLMQGKDSEWAWLSGDATVAPQKPNANTNGLLNFDKLYAAEGWLRLSNKKQ